MSRDTTVIAFRQPEAIDDPLSELAREGARCIPETPIALCGSICRCACHRENDAKTATSVSQRVGNGTQWRDTELVLS
jgi:hypothetical protein